MRNNANLELKMMLKREKIPYWQLAEKLKVHENTIVRRMHSELSAEEKFVFIRAAYAIIQERGGSDNEKCN